MEDSGCESALQRRRRGERKEEHRGAKARLVRSRTVIKRHLTIKALTLPTSQTMCSKNGKPYRCRNCAANTLMQLSRQRVKFSTLCPSDLKIQPRLSAQKLQCLAALRRWGAPECVGSEGVGSEGTVVVGGVKRGRGRPRKTGFA